jgi:hypothetical protein
VKEQKFENFFGRKIAVDASMHIYQFMVVVGAGGDGSGMRWQVAKSRPLRA